MIRLIYKIEREDFKNMKKINSKGFTLIELLAVITIMGILMLVAIPAVSRTIENSRRDTYMDTAKAYLNAVKNSVAADEIRCKESASDADYRVISAMPEGDYFLAFTTSTKDADKTITNKSADILEQGGKSSWGSADVKGTIKIHKGVDTTTGITKYDYAIIMIDEGGRGIGPAYVTETNLARQEVKTAGLNGDYANAAVGATALPESGSATAAATQCKVYTS